MSEVEFIYGYGKTKHILDYYETRRFSRHIEHVEIALCGAAGNHPVPDPKRRVCKRCATAARKASDGHESDERRAGGPGDVGAGDAGCGTCLTCDPSGRSATGFPMSRMYVCATCGYKRCPCASDCRKWMCSGSNAPGQIPVRRTGDATTGGGLR